MRLRNSVRLLYKAIVVNLFFVAGPVLAEKYCSTPEPSYNIDLGAINIDPGANVGDIVAQSGDIAKTISCAGAVGNTLIATLKANNNTLTNISINISGRPIYGEADGSCTVMESGYPGLGIAWYNYNSGTNRWHCFSRNSGQGRGLNSNGSVAITDVIYLVKTGDIGTGVFNFNQTFPISETGINPGYLPDYGLLYQITLSGDTTISAPVCTATAEKPQGKYQFSTEYALTQSYSTEDRLINVLCTGYIANGTIVPFKVTSTNGLFSLDSNYFATSDAGLGVSIKYKKESTSSEQILLPTGRIRIPISNNQGSFGVKFIPYVKSGTGVYPLSTDNTFTMELNASN